MVTAPASECEVSIDRGNLTRESGILFVIAALILFTSRTRQRFSVTENGEAAVDVSDWKVAGIAAIVLFCIAAFVVFVVHPGGFEGQIGWFFVLLPGAFVYGVIASDLAKLTSVLIRDTLIAFLIFGTSLLWYFAMSDAAMLIYRLSKFRSKRRLQR